MEIRMYDVNFGECILYSSRSSQLLVDCGAKFNGTGTFACSQVQKDIGDDASLLISHFDEDHYNGIIEMPKGKTFNRIFLPLYIWDKDKTSFTAKVFSDTIRSLAYLSIMEKPKLSVLQKLFVKLPQLVASPTDIKCIGATDTIFLGTYSFDVLWPEKSPKILRTRSDVCYSKKLRSILTEAGYADLESADMAVENYAEAFMSLYNFYAVKGTHDDDIDTHFLTRDHTIDYTLDELPDDSPEIRQWKRLQSNLVLTYSNLIHLRSISIPPLMEKHVYAISSSLIKGMNACSIVFHNDICLACGDITPGVMSYLSGKLRDHYKFIKVSHHGTKSYYSSRVPRANIYLISNSGGSMPNWGISQEYHNYHTSCCTNKNSSRCSAMRKCFHCNISTQHHARLIFANSSSCSVIV